MGSKSRQDNVKLTALGTYLSLSSHLNCLLCCSHHLDQETSKLLSYKMLALVPKG